MGVLNLKADAGSCEAVLAGVAIRADLTNNSVVYIVDLAVALGTRADAEVVGSGIGGLAGLGDAYDEAMDDESYPVLVAVQKPDEKIRLVLSAKAAPAGMSQGLVGDGDVIVQGTATVKQVKAQVGPKAQVVAYRMALDGLGAEIASRLASSLRRTCTVAFQRVQMDLFASKPASEPDGIRPGMLVVADNGSGEVTGLVVEVEDGKVTVSEEGTDVVFAVSEVISKRPVSDDERKLILQYKERLAESGLLPSYATLVEAVATSGQSVITLDAVESALDTLREQDAKRVVDAIDQSADDAGVPESAPVVTQQSTVPDAADGVLEFPAKRKARARGAVGAI